MTENSSHFTQESDVGNSANIHQGTEQTDISSENTDCVIFVSLNLAYN